MRGILSHRLLREWSIEGVIKKPNFLVPYFVQVFNAIFLEIRNTGQKCDTTAPGILRRRLTSWQEP